MVPSFLWENFDAIIAETQRRVLDPRFVDMVRSMSPVHAAMELCSVHIDPGRRCGKTTYIAERADRNSVVIAPNAILTRAFSLGRCPVLSAHELAQEGDYRIRGLRPRVVYIDEPALVFRELDKYKLYSMFCLPGHIPLFVLLGRAI